MFQATEAPFPCPEKFDLQAQAQALVCPSKATAVNVSATRTHTFFGLHNP